MKLLILAILALILASLGTALYFLLKDGSGRSRTVGALTVRIGLSIALFALLLIAHHLGWIQSTGLRY